MSDPTNTAEPAKMLSNEEMQAHFEGGPSIRNAVLVLLGDQLYKREDGCWRLLDDRAYRSVKEMTNGS